MNLQLCSLFQDFFGYPGLVNFNTPFIHIMKLCSLLAMLQKEKRANNNVIIPLPLFSHLSNLAILLGLKIQNDPCLSLSTLLSTITMNLYNISLIVKPRIHIHINMVKRICIPFLPMSCFLGKFCDTSKRLDSLRVLDFSQRARVHLWPIISIRGQRLQEV